MDVFGGGSTIKDRPTPHVVLAQVLVLVQLRENFAAWTP